MYEASADTAFFVYRVTTLGFLALIVALAIRRKSLRMSSHPSILVAVAIAASLIPTVLAQDLRNVDIDNFEFTGSLVRQGRFVYGVPWTSYFPFHPYLPFQMFIAAAADAVADGTNFRFAVLLKLPPVAATGILTLLVWRSLVHTHDAVTATSAALVVAINPVIVWITALHGQFDVIPTTLAFAAWYCLRFRSNERNEVASAVLLGAAILSKNWPLVLLPLMAFELRGSIPSAARYTTISLAIPIIATLLYAAALGGSVSEILDTVWNYRGVPGLSGYSMIVRHLPGDPATVADRMQAINDYGSYVLAIAIALTIASLLLQSQALLAKIVIVLLVFYVFSPATSEQYYVWIIPFAAASRQLLWLGGFSLLAGTGDCVIYCDDRGFFWGLPAFYVDHAWIVAAGLWVLTVVWLVYAISSTGSDEAEFAEKGSPKLPPIPLR